MPDRSLRFVLLGQDRTAGRTFDSVGKKTDALKSRVSGFAKFAGTAFGGLSVAAGGFAVAGAGMGIKTAAGMEQARIAFETMLGSGQKADAFLKDLQSFAAKTPFEFPELQTAASSLISAGVNASKVIPIMTTLGDVTSGMGTGAEGVQRATIALQQMNAAGRITGEDLNQLRDAGIPVFDLLAAATGESKTEVVKLAQAGKLGSKELGQLMSALESGKGMERFSGLMDKQSQSLSGLWATFQDTLGQGLAGLVTPLVPTLKRGLGGVSNAMGQFFGGIQGNVKMMSQDARPKIELFGLSLRAMVQAFKDPDVTSDGMVGAFERIGVAARAVVDGFRSAWPTIVKVLKQVWATAVVLGKAIGQGLRYAFDKIGAAVKDNRAQFAELGHGLIKVGQIILPLAKVTFAVLVNAIAIGVRVVGKLVDAFDAIKLPILSVMRVLSTVVLGFFGALINGAAKAFGWVPGIGPKLKGAAKEFNTFKDAVNTSLDALHKEQTIKIRISRIDEAVRSGDLSVSEAGAAGRNARGGDKVIVNNTITLDGKVIAKNTTQHQRTTVRNGGKPAVAL